MVQGRQRLLHRTVVPAIVAAAAVIGAVAWRSFSPEGELAHARLSVYGVTSCGVERWAVKTGIDADAGRVNRGQVVNTAIGALRALAAPVVLPNRTRVSPTELTVFRVTGYLLRIKQEADSDYHLVLADGSGRTMIAEIPAAQCVGSSSPFIHQIRYTRDKATSQFHPTAYWNRGHWPITVTGVGYFDFPHGQSGVAPNAIELHPVLAVTFGGSGAASSPSAHPTPTPRPASRSFAVHAAVSPGTVRRGRRATLTVTSAPGSSCAAAVVYSTGSSPRSFDGSAQAIGGSGKVSWSWTVGSSGSGGTATVTCTYGGKSTTVTARFAIT